jgi:hypothetical protein
MDSVKGATWYKNYTAQQHPNYQIVFSNFLKEQNFDSILEIGTAGGGFTLFMRDTLPNAKILSFDVDNKKWYDNLREHNIDIRVKNIFDDNIRNVINPAAIVDDGALEFIKNSNKLLILCDGSNKIGEFISLALYMKSGDFIMAHDYSESIQYFTENIKDKIWNWCEITEERISDSCIKNNLIDYNRTEFQSIVWTCKKKK